MISHALSLNKNSVLPGGAGCDRVAWLTMGQLLSPLEQASATLAAAQAEDGALRNALLRHAHSGPASANESTLDWFEKLVIIANAVPKDVRVAKISVSGSDPAFDDKPVLEGEAVATDKGLAEISGNDRSSFQRPGFHARRRRGHFRGRRVGGKRCR